MYHRHSDQELKAVYRERAGNDKHSELFLQKYHEIFDAAEQEPGYFDDGEEDELPKDMVLWHSTNIFLDKFLPLIENGHDPFWATMVADNIENEDLALGQTYESFKKRDIGRAKEQLIIFCKAKGEDDAIMHQYFIDLFEEQEYYDAFEHAERFARAYSSQIEKGRSELFARTYGELSSTSENLEIYCFVAADMYEKKLSEGWEEYEAHKYATEYAQMIANNYHDVSDIDKDPDFDIVMDLWRQRNGYN